MGKKCSKCKETKKLCEFHKNKLMEDGLSGWCKVCSNAGNKKYRETNKEKVIEKNRKWSEENSEKVIEKGRKWRETNKEKIIDSSKKWYKENKEKSAEKNRRYYEANKEKTAERGRKWNEENPEKIREYGRKRRAMKAEVDENYTKLDEAKTMKAFNNKCFNCGSTERLEIDHYYPLSKGNALTLSNAIVLCRSCNSSKHAKDPVDFFGVLKHTDACIKMLVAKEINE